MMDAAREWLLGVTERPSWQPWPGADAGGRTQAGGAAGVRTGAAGGGVPSGGGTHPAGGGRAVGYSAQIEEQADRLRTDTNDWMKLVIEEQCAAYVMDKAAELGITCQVRVTCTQEKEAGGVHSLEVQRDGDLAQEEQEQLVREIRVIWTSRRSGKEYIREESP